MRELKYIEGNEQFGVEYDWTFIRKEFKKLKTAIKSFKKDTWPQFDEGVIRNAAMLLEMSNSLGKIRSKMDEMTKPGYLSKLGSRANAEEDRKVQKNIDRQISKNGIDKVCFLMYNIGTK